MATSSSQTDVMQMLKNTAAALNSEVIAAQCDPREEVIIRYTSGTGHFSPDKKFISLKMVMRKITGEIDGWHEGVWEASFTDPLELTVNPAPPSGPLNKPAGPVPQLKPLAYTKGIWAFGDDSAIYAVGPALSHLSLLDDGSNIFFVSTAQLITGGDGKYQGARGVKTSLGTTWNDRNLFAATGDVTFHAATIDTFRVVKANDVA
jgi:hypothetical protein